MITINNIENGNKITTEATIESICSPLFLSLSLALFSLSCFLNFYCIAGSDCPWNQLITFKIYDKSTTKWSQAANMVRRIVCLKVIFIVFLFWLVRRNSKQFGRLYTIWPISLNVMAISAIGSLMHAVECKFVLRRRPQFRRSIHSECR